MYSVCVCARVYGVCVHVVEVCSLRCTGMCVWVCVNVSLCAAGGRRLLQISKTSCNMGVKLCEQYC